MNTSKDEDDSMMDAAVMLSSMSWVSASPTASSASSSSGSVEKPEESNVNNSKASSGTGYALLSLIRAVDMASDNETTTATSRKRKAASAKGPTSRKKEASSGDGRAKKARATKASSPRTSASKRKTRISAANAKPRGAKATAVASAAAGAALPQEADAQVVAPAHHTVEINPILEVEAKPDNRPIRARGRTKKRIEELESQLEALRKHSANLEQENASLKEQMQDMLLAHKKKKERKPTSAAAVRRGTKRETPKAATTRNPKGSAPRSSKTTSSDLLQVASTTFVTKPIGLSVVEAAKNKTKTDKKLVNNQQQGLLSINMPALRDSKQQQATLKTPPPPPAVTPPQTMIHGSGNAIGSPQEDFKQLLAALLGAESLGTAQKQRQDQDAHQQQELQRQQQQQQQAQELIASAGNNFSRLILEGFSTPANNGSTNNVQQNNKYVNGSSMGTSGGAVQSNSPLSSSSNSAVNNQSSPPLQAQQPPSFAEFVQQQLASLQAQQQAASSAAVKKTDDVWALLAPKELTPQQGKHAVMVEPPRHEQSDPGVLFAWLLQQQQQSPGPTKPETAGFGHVTSGYMPNRQEQQSQQSPRAVSEVFTVPEQQQQKAFDATLMPRMEASPLFPAVASNSATLRDNNDNNHVDMSHSFLNGQDFQSLQHYFTPEALLAILSGAQH